MFASLGGYHYIFTTTQSLISRIVSLRELAPSNPADVRRDNSRTAGISGVGTRVIWLGGESDIFDIKGDIKNDSPMLSISKMIASCYQSP